MTDIEALQDKLAVSFNNVCLLERALTHSSFTNENPGAESNERLEFLGDAVLGLIVAQHLYEQFSDLDEGQLTRLRAAVVCRDALSRMARAMGLGESLRLGKGEEATGGREKPLNLACVLEAVIGAIYLDQGEETARRFVLSIVEEEMSRAISQNSESDFKSRLQEVLQSNRHITPTYRLVEATGPDHCRVFTVEVLAGDVILGTGSGRSKKLAEIEAARRALHGLGESATG